MRRAKAGRGSNQYTTRPAADAAPGEVSAVHAAVRSPDEDVDDIARSFQGGTDRGWQDEFPGTWYPPDDKTRSMPEPMWEVAKKECAAVGVTNAFVARQMYDDYQWNAASLNAPLDVVDVAWAHGKGIAASDIEDWRRAGVRMRNIPKVAALFNADEARRLRSVARAPASVRERWHGKDPVEFADQFEQVTQYLRRMSIQQRRRVVQDATGCSRSAASDAEAMAWGRHIVLRGSEKAPSPGALRQRSRRAFLPTWLTRKWPR